MVLPTRNGNSSEIVLVDGIDFKLLAGYTWEVLRQKRDGYTLKYVRTIIGYYKEGKLTRARREYLHRMLMKPSKGLVVDHIDGNGLDNRRANLRVVTKSQNSKNRHHKA